MPEHINIDVDFDNSIDVTQVIGEAIIVPTVANFKGRYVYRLKFIPTLGDPLKLPTIGGLTKVEGVAPSTGEYRIVEQSLNLTHPSPHMIEFNSAQAGNSYTVDYWRYAESQDKEKVVYHDVARETNKSDGLELSFSTTQITIASRSYFYFREKIMIEDNPVVETPSTIASTTYYLYCDDFKGTNSYEGVYSSSTTAPSFDTARLGWYNNDSKAICKFITDSGNDIIFLESLGYKEPKLKILTLTDDYTLNQYEDYDIIECDGGSQAFSVTLPTGAVVSGKELFFKCTTLGGRVTVAGTIDGDTNLYLDSKDSYLHIYYNGVEWKKLKYHNVIDTGFITTNDQTLRDLGGMEVEYDNLTGSYVIGETVREYSDVPRTIPTGVYGIIMSDDGTTLKLKDVGGNGIFTNNLYLKGDTSAATSDVNEPTGSTQNLDSFMYHATNRSIDQFRTELYFDDGANIFQPLIVSTNGNPSPGTGVTYYEQDTDNIWYQTGGSGIFYINAIGNSALLTATSLEYKIKTTIDF